MDVISFGPNNALTITGTIVRFMSNGIQIQGGRGVGYFDVYTQPGTQISGPAPYVGEYIQAVGTGTPSTVMSATTSIQQVPIFTASGPIVLLNDKGFQIQGGPHVGFINIWVGYYTIINGAKPYVGEQVQAIGTGSLQTSLNAVVVTQESTGSPSPSPSPSPTATASPQATATPQPTATPVNTPSPSFTEPPVTAFMPNASWGKISPFQVFDETGNGYITQSAAQTDGYRYSAVWGARDNIGTAWLTSNSNLRMAYYSALEVDASPTAWGAIGHNLAWWQANHPDWILYACTSNGTPTTTPAYVPGLDSIPLDVHNPAVVDYQMRLWATFAHQIGYNALSVDEVTFWQADEGVPGGYGCGIYQNGSFVRRYTGSNDPNWENDVVTWVKAAHQLLTADPTLSSYHLKFVVNHPADTLTSNETTLLSNVDADLDETGYMDYGNYKTGNSSNFVLTTDWAKYAQEHGTAVLMNQNWGSVPVGAQQMDYSIATYLMGNEQAESIFASPSKGYGLEQYYNQYQTGVGAPCGEYASAGDPHNPSIYYRRFANAIVVVNGGSGSSNEVANLPSGHSYTDLFGRAVSNPLTIASNDGYVLLTSNGCQ